jgi:hypothetical protein
MESAKGSVIAVGAAAEAAAAHLCRLRSFAHASAARLDDLPPLLAGRAGTVLVVLDAADVEPVDLMRLAHQAATGAPEASLGVVFGQGEAGLLEAARRFSPAPSVAPPSGRQVLFSSLGPGFSVRGARLEQPQGEPASIHAGLLEPAEALYLLGHSNGAHMSLGGALLCRRSTAPVGPGDLDVYSCFHGDPCEWAATTGEIETAADSLRGRRLIFPTCFGVATTDHPFARHATLGEGLLRYTPAEALLTAVSVVTIQRPDLAMLYYLANAGLPFGAVANRLNQHRLRYGKKAEFLCFGDPETRLSPGLVPAAAVVEGDRVAIFVRGDAAGAAAAAGGLLDLVAALPASALPPSPVLIAEVGEGQEVTAALDLDGTLYATVPAGAPSPLRFRLISRPELADPGESARRILADLSFFDCYLPALAAAGDPEVVSALADALLELEDLLNRWPLTMIVAGECIPARRLAETWEALVERLERLMEAALSLYAGVMTSDFRLQPGSWSSYYPWTLSETDEGSCAYCGQPTRRIVVRAALGPATREFGYCLACGPVYDGDPGLGRFLAAPDRCAAGSSLELSLEVTNPYAVPLTAAAVPVLKHFARGRSRDGELAAAEVAPGGSARLDLRVEVPADFRPGTHHLSAALMIGGKLNFYRRLIQIAPLIAPL